MKITTMLLTVAIYAAVLVCVWFIPQRYHYATIHNGYLIGVGNEPAVIADGLEAVNGIIDEREIMVRDVVAWGMWPGDETIVVLRQVDGKYVTLTLSRTRTVMGRTYTSLDEIEAGESGHEPGKLVWHEASFWNSEPGYKRMAVAGVATLVVIVSLIGQFRRKKPAEN